MENPKSLELAAFISGWTWTIPDFDSFKVLNPVGHVETSPDQTFIIENQEYTFAYELTLNSPDSNPTIKLINKSNRILRIRSCQPPHDTFTVKPGGGCDGPEANYFWDSQDELICEVAFEAFIYDVPSSLHCDLLALLDDPEKSDFMLICEDQKFPCHSLILRARSPVLAAAFESSEPTKMLKIDGFKPSSVRRMLEFIYSDAVNSDPDADLLKLADYFNIQGLNKICDRRLAESVVEDNVFDLLTLAESVPEAKILMEKVLDFIVENYKHLKETPKWDQMKIGRLQALLDHMNSKLTEKN